MGAQLLGGHYSAHFPSVSPEQLKSHLLPGAPRRLSIMWLWSSGTRYWGLPTQGNPCLGASSQGGRTRFLPPSLAPG